MGYHSMKWYGRAVELKNIVRVSSHGTVWAASMILDVVLAWWLEHAPETEGKTYI